MATKKEKEIVYVTKQSYKAALGVAIIALLVIALIVSNYNKEENTTKEYVYTDIEKYTSLIDTDEYLTKTDDTKLNVYLFASPSCSYCQKFEPILMKVIDKYDLDVYYINTYNATDEDISNIENSATDLEDFGTPTMVVTKNGEVIDVNIGYVTESTLINFLTENGVITE